MNFAGQPPCRIVSSRTWPPIRSSWVMSVGKHAPAPFWSSRSKYWRAQIGEGPMLPSTPCYLLRNRWHGWQPSKSESSLPLAADQQENNPDQCDQSLIELSTDGSVSQIRAALQSVIGNVQIPAHVAALGVPSCRPDSEGQRTGRDVELHTCIYSWYCGGAGPRASREGASGGRLDRG